MLFEGRKFEDLLSNNKSYDLSNLKSHKSHLPPKILQFLLCLLAQDPLMRPSVDQAIDICDFIIEDMKLEEKDRDGSNPGVCRV